MDRIKITPTYPQKVEVVNNPENPQLVEVSNLPFNSSGYLNVNVVGGALGVRDIRPSSSSSYFIQLDNILLLQSDGTFVPIPLNSQFLSLTISQINSLLDSYKTAYSTLVSGVTAATLHYSKMTSSFVVSSEVYNLKD